MVRIGWIKPDDGERANGKLLDYECFTLGDWLRQRGIEDCIIDVELSPAEPFHTVDDLTATGGNDRLGPCAVNLANRGADIVAWVCTSGSFAGGRQWAEAQRDALAVAARCPAVTTSLAIVDALAVAGIAEIDLLSPYPHALTQRLVEFLHDHGIAPGRVGVLDCETGGTSHRLDIVAELRAFTTGGQGRPILLPDTAINTIEIGPLLEEVAGRTVITANQASLWGILKEVRGHVAVPHSGSLLEGRLAGPG